MHELDVKNASREAHGSDLSRIAFAARARGDLGDQPPERQ